jgi:iron complex transport system substrate-binding protein
LGALLLLALALSACAVPQPPVAPAPVQEAAPAAQISAPEANITDGCAEAYDPSIDYFPDKVSVDYATGFQVEYHNNYKVVTVSKPWQGAEEGFQYVLVQCGTPAPEGFENASVIEVPVKSIIAMSTTYLPHLAALGLTDRLLGLDSFLYVNTPEIVERIKAGELAEVGSGSTVNVELVLDLQPDLVMTYGIGIPDYDAHPKLLEAGVNVAINGDFVESSPLGRTEWSKFLAVFFNREKDAQANFAATAAHYNELVQLAASVEERPSVLVGSVYNGTWYVAGGNSYTAQMLSDAGAAYVWADQGDVGSIPFDFETVFDMAADADYWVNPDNPTWLTAEDVLATDARYGDFAAFQNGNLYNNNLRVNENGGNDYYETGVASPDIVLMDLIRIFHPELLPDHELTFYRRIAPAQ